MFTHKGHDTGDTDTSNWCSPRVLPTGKAGLSLEAEQPPSASNPVGALGAAVVGRAAGWQCSRVFFSLLALSQRCPPAPGF